MKKYIVTKTTAMSGFHLKEGREVWVCKAQRYGSDSLLLLCNTKSRSSSFATVHADYLATFAVEA